jgi:hypothetical protein
MNHSENTSNFWTEAPFAGIPGGYFAAFPTIDGATDRILFAQGYSENDQLVMSALTGRITVTGSLAVRDVEERKWTMDKKSLFGETGPNVKLNESGKRESVGVGPHTSILNDSNWYFPYCLNAFTVTSHLELGPFNNGVFHSTDSGLNWEMEKVSSDFQGFDPSVCKSKEYYYYFATRIVPAHGYQLWFSRKLAVGISWDAPKSVTKTFATVYGRYAAVAENDTVHVCWMDRRHDKWRVSFGGPNIENDDIAYCYRKDSDKLWSKNIILSRGLLYSYAPSMSVEGDKIVVAWAGIRTAGKQHTYYDPNDIYYVTSKDNGKTWAKPLKVTDGVKDGITAGYPQVMLLNDVIHLLYTQGKRESQQISPGLTRLNQGSWPIYYTQRPFPD